MLGFFRKYQKFFFIIVTIFVVISFSFFGTFSTFTNEEKSPDRVIGKTVTGTQMTSRELDAINRLIAVSYEERTTTPNLFNDGVLRKEFLHTGMAEMLAERHFGEIQGELAERLKKVKHYKPYVHPKAPFISAEMVWQQYFPGMSQDLAQVKGYVEGATLDDFHLLMRLYLSQLQLPPDSLKQLLAYQQSHYQNVPPDPRLQQLDLSLFGFHTFEDWFGPQFLQQVSRFILNSAAVAVKKGYEVTSEEVRADLFQNVQTALKAYGVKAEEAPAYFEEQLRLLQLDEITVTKAWRKVMLFRRLFHDVGGAVVVDPYLYQSFEKYAHEGVVVDLYQLPEELRIKDADALAKLQMYLEAVTANKGHGEMLPTHFLSPEEVEVRFPELALRRFVIEFSEANKQQIASQVSLKETWNWELEEKNWELLKDEFSFACEASDPQERFAFLEKMDSKERLKIDAYARMKIVDSHPDWVEEALARAEVHKEALSIRTKGGNLPFSGIKDSGAFADLLQEIACRPDQLLERFSGDGISYYNVKVLEAPARKEVLTFAEALRDGTLQALTHPRSFDSRPELRLAAYMKEAKRQVEIDPDGAWVKSANSKDLLSNQWLLEKTTRTITRASQDSLLKETFLDLPVGSWSEVQTPENGDIFFVHVLKKVEEIPKEVASQGQEILSLAARRLLMSVLLDEMEGNEPIPIF